MSEKLYNELAKYYDLFNFSDYEKQADFILFIARKNLKAKKDIKVLDLACGTGEHIKILKKHFQIEGRDLNKGMLKFSQKKNHGVVIEKGDLNNLHIKKSSFDLIYCLSSSIQYVLNPKKLPNVFKTIYIGLKPKGIFIFDLAYCREKWQEGYVGIRTVVNKDLQIAEIFKSRSINNISYYNPIYLLNNKDNFKFYIDDHKIYLYSIKEVKLALEKTGFSQIYLKDNYSDRDFNNKNNKLPVFVAIK